MSDAPVTDPRRDGGSPASNAPGSPRLLDRLRQTLRTRHYSPRTEKAYVVFCVLNPVFEEGLYAVLAKFGAGLHAMAGILLSVGLRYSIHLYQGPAVAFVDVALIGGAFTAYYVRYRRVWPPVIAHAIYNAVELGWLPECAA